MVDRVVDIEEDIIIIHIILTAVMEDPIHLEDLDGATHLHLEVAHHLVDLVHLVDLQVVAVPLVAVAQEEVFRRDNERIFSKSFF